MIKIKALSNFDGFVRGQTVELPPEYAKAVIKKRLAEEVGETKKAADPVNKMAAEPANKSATKRTRKDDDNEDLA